MTAWLVQGFARFPPHSRAGGLTAVVFLGALLLEVIPASIATTGWIRSTERLSWTAYVLTAIAGLLSLLGLILLFTLL
jgi:hypothetical protein